MSIKASLAAPLRFAQNYATSESLPLIILSIPAPYAGSVIVCFHSYEGSKTWNLHPNGYKS
jgi:hypothetical protein